MATKLGRDFLALLDQCYPVGHQLRRTFNRHTVQLSYWTMPNMGNIIAANNKKVLGEDKAFERQLPRNSNCNCRGGEKNCPMEGARCLDSNILYHAKVEEEGKPDAGYVGLTANTFKVRYGNHKTSFKYSAKRINSSLAGHVWRLKDANRPFNITWTALATYPDFNPSTNSCRLCLMEKYTIMHRPDIATINQRDEFFTPCQHKQSKLLDNAIT